MWRLKDRTEKQGFTNRLQWVHGCILNSYSHFLFCKLEIFLSIKIQFLIFKKGRTLFYSFKLKVFIKNILILTLKSQLRESQINLQVHFFTKIQIWILIQKWTFRFFTKIQKWIIDPNDPQLRWILWIISKTGYFGYMIQSDSLLQIWKEWILPAVTRINLNTFICCLTTLLILMAIFLTQGIMD